MWTIGLTRSGNMVGLDAESFTLLSITQQKALLEQAASRLLDAGADFVAEDLSACDRVLAQIEARLEGGDSRKDEIMRIEV